MKTRKSRPIFFVCSAVKAGTLISHTVQAENTDAAISFFEKEHQVPIERIHGPFKKKKMNPLEYSQPIQFAGSMQKAEYNGWYVSAFLLKEPANYAFLLHERKVDGTKTTKPKGTFIIRLSDLRLSQPIKVK